MQPIHIVYDGIEPEDIYQGKLGDCYFLSSISALAENPERVQRLLETEEPNEKGVYAINLNINGDWEQVILDDYFPTNARRITFCHSSDPELWTMLLEKAYAKIYGGYWNIGTGGFAEDSLKDLTGAPTEYMPLKDGDDPVSLFDVLLNHNHSLERNLGQTLLCKEQKLYPSLWIKRPR